MSTSALDAVPTDHDFSFLLGQLPELRRGMLERARSGQFLDNFKDSSLEDRTKVAEWQANMATFLEVMEERDLEAQRAKVLLKLVRDLLDQGEIKPPLRRLAREYTDAVRDATSFDTTIPPVPREDGNFVRALWLSGPPPPLRFPPGGAAHLASLFDYALRRAAGRIPNPWTTFGDDDVPDLVDVTDSSDDADVNVDPEITRLVARRELLDHFAARAATNDGVGLNSARATPAAPAPSPTPAAPAPSATPANPAINGRGAVNATATDSVNRVDGTSRRSRHRGYAWVEVEEDA